MGSTLKITLWDHPQASSKYIICTGYTARLAGYIPGMPEDWEEEDYGTGEITRENLKAFADTLYFAAARSLCIKIGVSYGEPPGNCLKELLENIPDFGSGPVVWTKAADEINKVLEEEPVDVFIVSIS